MEVENWSLRIFSLKRSSSKSVVLRTALVPLWRSYLCSLIQSFKTRGRISTNATANFPKGPSDLSQPYQIIAFFTDGIVTSVFKPSNVIKLNLVKKFSYYMQ